VEITDANGVVHTAVTNEAGNFSFSMRQGAIATPYTARVGYDGRWAAMTTPQTITACNTCHTEQGANLATGRIVAP
jgi:hypothetical protein